MLATIVALLTLFVGAAAMGASSFLRLAYGQAEVAFTVEDPGTADEFLAGVMNGGKHIGTFFFAFGLVMCLYAVATLFFPFPSILNSLVILGDLIIGSLTIYGVHRGQEIIKALSRDG